MKPLDATPCYDNPHPYDVLMDERRGTEALEYAVNEAHALCSRCPVWAKCFADNRNEIWVKRIMHEARYRERRRMAREAAA